ncbi:dienelactone hydrolase family protein [Glaciihabitans sp. dw_435]|uniref:dienelactone hydrolase family protein n=1 Tax=Glaciihabitans sp. dw_435 TaxID=2720081 RepID=UPI001BD294E5|nr:alpha/beta fold hydrolase [Glaciihabitans sp. dw_435]
MPELIPIPSPGVPLWWGQVGGPLVVLIHDWYGRLPWLSPYAEALSRHGFRVAVVDLYGGVATDDTEDAERLMIAMDIGTALAEIDEVIAEARAQGSSRIATVGFSIGGWLALLHAQGGATDAVVAYYATLGVENHGVIPCPVLLEFAEFDEWGAGEEPSDFISRLADHGTPVTEHVHPGTQHGFANATIADRLEAPAAQLAFHHTEMFLRSYLLD